MDTFYCGWCQKHKKKELAVKRPGRRVMCVACSERAKINSQTDGKMHVYESGFVQYKTSVKSTAKRNKIKNNFYIPNER